MTTIAVLGAGMMATALATPLSDNGHDVRIVGTHLDRNEIDSMREKGVHPRLTVRVPPSVRAYQLEEAAEAFEGASVVMVGVNSFGVRWAGEQLAGLLRPGQDVIAVVKGMEADDEGNLRILPDVMAEQVPPELRAEVSWSAIVGPSIAGEVAARRHTCVVLAGLDEAAIDRLRPLFRTDYYHVWKSTDLVGAEIAAALKNCYALSVGLAHGMLEAVGETDAADRNHNFEAALIAQGFHEICGMLDLLGGRRETSYELPSVGDMYVTSVGGRNVKVGRLLGEGVKFTEAWERLGKPTLEGAAAIRVIGGALPRLTERGLMGADDLPLLRHLHEVIALEQPIDIPWSRFFRGEH
jgi:glycerol-3-phosphate dehydrogenase (NAD(P)+)